MPFPLASCADLIAEVSAIALNRAQGSELQQIRSEGTMSQQGPEGM